MVGGEPAAAESGDCPLGCIAQPAIRQGAAASQGEHCGNDHPGPHNLLRDKTLVVFVTILIAAPFLMLLAMYAIESAVRRQAETLN